MLRLKGETQRQQIARVIADVVEDNVALMKEHIEWTVPFAHEVTKVELTRRKLTEDDVKEAAAHVKAERQRYETLKEALDNDPSLRSKPRWYTEVTRAHAMMRRHERVLERYELEKTQPTYPAEIHVIRLGDLALATNPFELYVDYGMQIQGRSPAEHTVLIQLSGPGTGNFYIPTERSIAHGGYGAVPASTIVGPEGGRELVEHTVAMLNQLWTGGDE